MPSDDPQDDLAGDLGDEVDDEGDDGSEGDDLRSSPLVAGARRLRDGPLWLGLAPAVILGATLIATLTGSVAVILAVLFGGAAIWGFLVWRFARAR